MLGFRVWDTYSKEMINGHDIEPDDNIWMEMDGTLSVITYGPQEESGFIPMQSTGRRADSLSHFPKETDYDLIYEGDIVKVKFTEMNHEYDFLVNSIPYFYDMLPARDIKFHLFILGNRFESPELLEHLK